MEWKDLLYELVEVVKNASEMAWIIGNRQVMVIAIQQCIWAVLCITGAVGFWKLARYCKKEEDEGGDAWLGLVFSCIAAGGLSIIGSGLLVGALGRFINPNYYTIYLLLALAKGN